MNRNLVLAFDVGGTQIKAAALVDGAIVDETVSQYDSHADLDKAGIIAHFANIAADVVRRAGMETLPIIGFGLAFPGPFDYENGISYIRGLGKFEALYGIAVGELLLKAIRSHVDLAARLAPSFEIRFENDAALFGLGEFGYGDARGRERVVCLTIGTGLGSCFLEKGRLVKEREGVPDQGWLYAIPYKGKLADDWISRRGVLQLAAENGFESSGRDVRDLAMLAQSGDGAAANLFELFGRRMSTILASSLRDFAPECIVIGGQISKSGGLFVPAFQEELRAVGVGTDVRVSKDTLGSTLKGIYDYVTRGE